MSESERKHMKFECQKHQLPKEVCIPEDFEGVVQVNIQSQKETETETITQAQSTAVAISQMQAQLQNLMQPITVQVQQTQAQVQACGAQLQALQNQMQLLFLAILGAPGGADAAQRQEMLREIVEALRNRPQ